jgi:D-xylose transport system permease protein
MLAFRGILIGITNGTTVSPTSAAMSQIGQSYLPDGVGFTIGVVGLLAFVAWQWRGRMRRQALGLASPASTSVVGRQALTAVIVLGAIWLLNDYRGVPTPVLLLALLLLGGMFMATRTAFGRRIYAIGGNLEAARLSGINVERTKLAVFAINGLMVAIAGLILSSRLGPVRPPPVTSPSWMLSPPASLAAPASQGVSVAWRARSWGHLSWRRWITG